MAPHGKLWSRNGCAGMLHLTVGLQSSEEVIWLLCYAYISSTLPLAHSEPLEEKGLSIPYLALRAKLKAPESLRPSLASGRGEKRFASCLLWVRQMPLSLLEII